MALGYCKHHKSNDVKDHLFEIDDRDEIVECPFCHKKMKRNEAIKAYADKLNHYIYWGRFHLFVTTYYKKAYRFYAHALEMDNQNVNGYTGRICSLFMMSTLRNPRIEDTKEMVIQAFALLSKDRSNHKIIVYMIAILDRYIKKYLLAVKKKLMHRVHFHDKDCIKLYLDRVLEAKDLRELLLKETLTLFKKHPDEEKEMYEQVIKMINESIDKDNFDLTQYQPCLDGYSYKALFDKNGEITLIDDGIKQKVNLSAYHPFSLHKERAKYTIKDRVFSSFSKQYNFFLSTSILIVLTFLISIGCTISAFIFTNLKLLLISLGILFILISATLVVFRIILYAIIRKKLRKGVN